MHQVEEFAVSVQQFVSRRVTNHADAADITQQALMLACAKFSTLRGDNVRGWLLAIARHLIVDHYRTRARLQFVTVDHATDEGIEPALRIAPDAVLTACECHQRLRVWRKQVTQLRLDQQVAVLLADTYEYSDKESAALLRLSVPCFKLLLHGARVRLRDVVAGDRKRASQASVPAYNASAVHGDQAADEPEKGPLPAAHPIPHVGVTCRLSARELLALRGRLLDGLGVCLQVLCCLSTDESFYLLINCV